MAEYTRIAGGVQNPSSALASADQETIVGSGTTEDPLRVGASGRGVEVSSDGVPVPGGPFTRLDFEGAASATDAGSGVARVEVTRGVTVLDEGVPVAGNPHDALDFVGDGVHVTDAGGGRATVSIPGSPPGAAILTWGYGTLTAGASSRTCFLQGGCTNNDTLIPPSTVNVPVPFAGVVRNFYVRHDGGDGDGSVVHYTLFRNGLATTLTIGLATGSTGEAHNTTDSVTVSAGDLLSIQAECAIDGLFEGRLSLEVAPS